MLPNQAQDEVTIRKARPEDSSVCGQICYDAFNTISQRHSFPCDFPEPERATAVVSMMFSHPGFYCVVVEIGGRVVGSNCLDERSTIAGVGPIAIDPKLQKTAGGRLSLEIRGDV